MRIEADMDIEIIIDILPESASYLMDKGIVCIACGAPVWDTLREGARKKHIPDDELAIIVDELNDMLESK